MTFLVSSVSSLECVSMENQECKVREKIINNELVFHPFSIKVKECRGGCNNINNTYTRSCVPDVVKNINLKVFNLMSWKNQTKQIKWGESCKC